MQGQVPVPITEGTEEMGGAPAPSIDLVVMLVAVLRHWKLIAAFTLGALIAAYGGLKFIPSLYKSTVEILVFDPQKQIDAAVQKPISPFVDAIGFDAISTEITILKSKSVALRVAKELELDKDPEFRSDNGVGKWFGWLDFSRADTSTAQSTDGTEAERAEKLDRVADALRGRLQVWPESYVIFVSTTSESPIQAQRLASTVAKDYLDSQREARQEALQRVSTWLKSRVDDLQSRVLETESSIEKLKAEMGMNGANDRDERQIADLNTQLGTARSEVGEKRARLEQARHVINTNGDIQGIPELTASAVLTGLRQKQTELNWRVSELQSKVGEHHGYVITLRAELAGVNKQIAAEAEHILGNMKNAYDIAVRQQQSLEANLQKLTGSPGNSDRYLKLQQLRHVADTDRNLYQSYLSQYNDIAQRRTLQEASARIISPATLPTSPSSPRRKLFYAIAAIGGLGSGLLFAFLLEYFRAGIKTGAEIEQSFGFPVVGIIPLVPRPKSAGTVDAEVLRTILDDPLSAFSEAVRAMRIGLALSNAGSKVVLVTSALPAEGKSTAAMLLAVSSASSGKRTVLLDCDLRQQSSSHAFGMKDAPGLSELLRGAAELKDVIARDTATQTYMIPAGSMVPNGADWLMSQEMSDLVAELREEFDYIVMDAAPLLPVVDALALATIADKVLLIVEWGQTPLASISEAFKILRPTAHRIAGVVLNKADQKQLPGYAAYYRSSGRYLSNA